MTPTPTPAQRVALEAIRDGKVERYYPMRLGYRNTASSRWVNADGSMPDPSQAVTTRCFKAGWVRVLPTAPGRTRGPVELTDAGREALDAA